MAEFASLDGRRILITGGGRGFGREMALAFAAQGARLVLTAARNQDELSDTVAAANRVTPGCCSAIAADVSRTQDCTRAVGFAEERLGGVDVLINNAARGPTEAMTRYDAAAPSPFWDADPEGYERLIVTNMVGPFLMARAVVSGMIGRRFGRIVNLLTSRPTMVVSGRGPYGASKAGLEASTIIWARDLAGTGVTVNGLLPGGVSDTALIPGGTVGQRAIPGFKAGVGRGGEERPLEGMLPADIVVAPALWLAADESHAWNGRRFVARYWDDSLGWDIAAAQSATEPEKTPKIL